MAGGLTWLAAGQRQTINQAHAPIALFTTVAESVGGAFHR
jgi:hypothetical protein